MPRLEDHYIQLGLFIGLFGVVTIMGFVASKWRRPQDLNSLDEWGLGGRSFGAWVTWFLLGGDIYTAYTFIAVPALIFAVGAAAFMAVPYTIIVFPIVFLAVTRMWSVSHVHGFVTPADFVRARFGSPTLALLVAVLGIVATMPYIALQLVGISAVLKTMGINGTWPITGAFLVLAVYTYQSGLRAPALISFVKDGLVYLTIFAAILVLPFFQGGWGQVFRSVKLKFDSTAKLSDDILLNPNNQLQYVTLAVGSALALFLYPHVTTGILAARNRDTIRRNMAALPLYSLMLALIALLGFIAIGAGITPIGADPEKGIVGDLNTVIPVLFDTVGGPWFAGVVFATIGIAALVPAAIMSIAAANLFTRNIYREFLRPDATPAQEARVSKIVSLVVKFGAMGLLLGLPLQFSLDLQLMGGVIILQTLPAVALGLYTRWFHRWGLVSGLVVGLAVGMFMLYQIPQMGGPAGKTVLRPHFGGAAWAVSNLGIDSKITVYVGFIAVLVNLAIAALLTLVLRTLRVPDGRDRTRREDFFADEGDARVHDFTGLIDGDDPDRVTDAPEVVPWTGIRPVEDLAPPPEVDRYLPPRSDPPAATGREAGYYHGHHISH